MRINTKIVIYNRTKQLDMIYTFYTINYC